MTTTTRRKTLRIGHSPDPDDAFMWYPLANFVAPDGTQLKPRIDTASYDFIHVLEDIQSLNERSQRGELEITALSIHQYPFVADQYALTACGASMGDSYGPMIVAPQPLDLSQLKGMRLAIPGHRTTAWLATQILLAEHDLSPDDLQWQPVMFDQIIPEVVAGRYDAGLIIHEGQLTFSDAGLHCVADLGRWWTETRQLPLPLGGNAIRRDLAEESSSICAVLRASIDYALAHRDEAVDFALNYARDLGRDLADRFVGMYVNAWTLDLGARGRAAVRRLLREGSEAGIVPDCGPIDFVEPEPRPVPR